MFWYFLLNAADAFLTLVLGCVVILKSKAKSVGYALAAWLFSISVWSFGVAMHARATDPDAAMFWSEFLHVGAVPLPLLYLHFTLTLLNIRRTKLIFGLAIPILIFMFLIPTRYFIRGVSQVGLFDYFPQAGPIYPFYVAVFTICVMIAFYFYAKALKALQGVERNRVKYVFYGSAIGFAGGATAFLPEFNIAVFPFGTPWVVFNAFLITFAILRYRLMDITIIIRKTLVYSAVIGALTCIYLLIIALFTNFFQGLTGYQTVFSSAVAALLIAICFQPLRKKVQDVIDSKFFRQYVDREEKLYELSREVITHTTPEAMAQSLIRVLADTLHPKAAALYLKSRDGDGFSLVSEQGGANLPALVSDNNPLTRYFRDHPQPFVQQDVPAELAELVDTRRPPRKESAA